MLTDIRRRTERLAEMPDTEALKARILWASPDEVVIEGSYDTDLTSRSVDNKDHRSVCKPKKDNQKPEREYRTPWKFVERGVC